MTAAARLAALRMSEAQLLSIVRSQCRELGLLCYHAYDSRRSEPGFPDLVIAGQVVLWVECKSQHGVLTFEQRLWGRQLCRAGQRWQVWRPSDLLSGRITAELSAIRHREIRE